MVIQPSIELHHTLRLLRKISGLNQTAVGELLGLHQTAVCRVEQGSQLLTPEQLFLLADHFGVEVDALRYGEVDCVKVAQRFGTRPPLPPRYVEFPFAKVRELQPLLKFLRDTKGPKAFEAFLTQFELVDSYLRAPDMTIGSLCNLDMASTLIKNKTLNETTLPKIIARAYDKDVQGFLHNVYAPQKRAFGLIQAWVLNSHQYETNFCYKIEELKREQIVISVTPRAHMKDLPYRTEILGDYLCRYRKTYFAEFPRYIGQPQIMIKERECHFHQAEQCIYEMKTA